MPVTLLQRIEAAGFFSQLRESAFAYPVLLWLHLISLCVWGGLMLWTDLHMLGGKNSAVDVIAGYRLPKRISFLVAAICGVLLFGAKAGQYAFNRWFWVKILLLLLLGANYLIFRRGLRANLPNYAGRMRLAAGLSLVLWTGSVCAARGPATIKDIMHAMVDPNSEYLFQSVQFISDRFGDREIAPRTDEEWNQVRARANVLLKVPDLLTAPGRRVARPRDQAMNPEVEIETEEMQNLMSAQRQDFILRAQKLHDAASLVMRAIDAKDKDALSGALNGIDRACEGCHVRYWYPNDQRAVEEARQTGIIE